MTSNITNLYTPPQLLKGLTIVFTGEFSHPYSKLALIKMCRKLGAKSPNYISRTTSVLIQGSYIQGCFGNISKNVNSTKKTVQARERGIWIVQNDEIDDYFKQITGKSLDQLMKISQNPLSYNVLQILGDNQLPDDEESSSISNPSQSTSKALLRNQKRLKQRANFIQQMKKSQLTIEKAFKIKGIQEIKNKNNSSCNNKNDSDLQPIRIDQSQENTILQLRKTNRSLESQNKVLKESLKQTRDEITSSLQSLKQIWAKQKGNYYESYHEILDQLKQIKEFTSFQKLSQKTRKAQDLADTCFTIYRKLNRNFQEHEKKMRSITDLLYKNKYLSADKPIQKFVDQNLNQIKQKQTLEETQLNEKHFKNETKKLHSFSRQLEQGQTDSLEGFKQRNSSQKARLSSRFNQQRLSKKEQLMIKKQTKEKEEQNQRRESSIGLNRQSEEVKMILKNGRFSQLKKASKTEKILIKIQDQVKQPNLNLNHPNNQNTLLPVEIYFCLHFQSDAQKLRRYKQISQKVRKTYCQSLGQSTYDLDHHGINLNMAEFIKYDWSQVGKLNLNECGITSQGWRILVGHAYIFKSLKILSLASNKIQHLQIQDLNKLQHLKVINFGLNEQSCNPLNKASIESLRHYIRFNNQRISISFWQIQF